MEIDLIKIVPDGNSTNHVRVLCDDGKYIRNLDYHFSTQVPGSEFIARRYGGQPKVQNFFSISYRKLPIGLLNEMVKWTRSFFPLKLFQIDPDVKDRLINERLENYEFEHEELWDHQVRIIKKCLYVKRSCIESYVSSGKTYIMGKLAEILIKDVKECKKCLIIVPLKQLVYQTADEIVSRTNLTYGDICIHHGGMDLEDKPIIISTWQSLNYLSGKMKKEKQELVKKLSNEVDLLLADEAHTTKATTVNKICNSFTKCKYRHGFSGTLPKNDYDKWMIYSSFGPQIERVTPEELKEKDLISEPKIYNIHLKYDTETNNRLRFLDYNSIRLEIFKNNRRLGIIERIINKSRQKNFLILVTNVEDEGMILREHLSKSVQDREIVFLSGKHSSIQERLKYTKDAEKRDDLVLISTYGIFKMGISIRNIHHLIFGSTIKSFISVRQSLGRGLRTMSDKQLVVYNLIDDVKILRNHGEERKKIFEEDNWECINHEVNLF